MPIKRIFGRNNEENSINSTNDYDKQILRINALEVQMKKLLEFEKEIRLAKYGTDKLVKDRRSWTEQKKVEANKSEQEFHSKRNAENNLQVQKVNELSQRIDHLEKLVQEMMRLHHRPRENRSSGQEQSDSFSIINRKVRELEKNYLMVNEVQAGILKQMEELAEKLENWEKPEREETEQHPIINTLYIDKFYLDKYEQTNNLGQIGIHELSGALNIGATYGKDVVPKQVTEEIKEEMEKIKANMAEKEKPQTSTDEADKPPKDESSDEGEEEEYIEIEIE